MATLEFGVADRLAAFDCGPGTGSLDSGASALLIEDMGFPGAGFDSEWEPGFDSGLAAEALVGFFISVGGTRKDQDL